MWYRCPPSPPLPGLAAPLDSARPSSRSSASACGRFDPSAEGTVSAVSPWSNLRSDIKPPREPFPPPASPPPSSLTRGKTCEHISAKCFMNPQNVLFVTSNRRGSLPPPAPAIHATARVESTASRVRRPLHARRPYRPSKARQAVAEGPCAPTGCLPQRRRTARATAWGLRDASALRRRLGRQTNAPVLLGDGSSVLGAANSVAGFWPGSVGRCGGRGRRVFFVSLAGATARRATAQWRGESEERRRGASSARERRRDGAVRL